MRVLVVGDIILDKYIEGRVTRISPEAPVPVVSVTSERLVLGGSANVAHNLAKLEVETTIIGVIGDDGNGKHIQELLTEYNINSQLIISSSLPTISKIRVIGEKQQIARIDYEDGTKKISLDELNIRERLRDRRFDLIVISDYNKNVCTTEICKELISFASENNIRVLVDPKGNDWGKYSGSFIITPNHKELQEVSNSVFGNLDSDIEKFGGIVKERYQISNLIVTRSERGITLLDSDNVKHFPTKAREVFDVSGAGDTVIAVLAKYIAEGVNLEDAIKFANIAAGYVISKMGTYAISKDELDQLILDNGE